MLRVHSRYSVLDTHARAALILVKIMHKCRTRFSLKDAPSQAAPDGDARTVTFSRTHTTHTYTQTHARKRERDRERERERGRDSEREPERDVHTHTYTHTYTHTHTHTHTHTPTRTHTHTHTHSLTHGARHRCPYLVVLARRLSSRRSTRWHSS